MVPVGYNRTYKIVQLMHNAHIAAVSVAEPVGAEVFWLEPELI